MKTGLPRHLMMTYVAIASVRQNNESSKCVSNRMFGKRTFLPSGIVLSGISTLACAKTSAEADMLTMKSEIRFNR